MIVEVCEETEEPCGLEADTEETECQETWEKVAEGQPEKETTQAFQQNYEEQRMTVQKRDSSFCLNMEFGKCGGKVSCKGFDVVITESSSENQSVRLEIFYELPSPSYLSSGEMLLSPLIVVGNMSEDETELRLTFPFLRDLPEDADSMAKWIRFYGGSSGDDVPMWQDIRTAEELDAFMVEIQQDYAKLHTQQNVSFCIVGSRDEPAVLYDYGTGLEGEAYGDYTYTYEEYAAYYGTYDTANYGENYYAENNDGESNVTENNVAENNTADNFVTENVGASEDSSDDPGTNVTLASASAALEKALQSPIPRPALGLPAPDVPTTQRPARPHPSPFDNVPLEKETKKKLKVKKVWKSSKSKKKDKDK